MSCVSLYLKNHDSPSLLELVSWIYWTELTIVVSHETHFGSCRYFWDSDPIFLSYIFRLFLDECRASCNPILFAPWCFHRALAEAWQMTGIFSQHSYILYDTLLYYYHHHRYCVLLIIVHSRFPIAQLATLKSSIMLDFPKTGETKTVYI